MVSRRDFLSGGLSALLLSKTAGTATPSSLAALLRNSSPGIEIKTDDNKELEFIIFNMLGSLPFETEGKTFGYLAYGNLPVIGFKHRDSPNVERLFLPLLENGALTYIPYSDKLRYNQVRYGRIQTPKLKVVESDVFPVAFSLSDKIKQNIVRARSKGNEIFYDDESIFLGYADDIFIHDMRSFGEWLGIYKRIPNGLALFFAYRGAKQPRRENEKPDIGTKLEYNAGAPYQILSTSIESSSPSFRQAESVLRGYVFRYIQNSWDIRNYIRDSIEYNERFSRNRRK